LRRYSRGGRAPSPGGPPGPATVPTPAAAPTPTAAADGMDGRSTMTGRGRGVGAMGRWPVLALRAGIAGVEMGAGTGNERTCATDGSVGSPSRSSAAGSTSVFESVAVKGIRTWNGYQHLVDEFRNRLANASQLQSVLSASDHEWMNRNRLNRLVSNRLTCQSRFHTNISLQLTFLYAWSGLNPVYRPRCFVRWDSSATFSCNATTSAALTQVGGFFGAISSVNRIKKLVGTC
jgi:hypothetical protein